MSEFQGLFLLLFVAFVAIGSGFFGWSIGPSKSFIIKAGPSSGEFFLCSRLLSVMFDNVLLENRCLLLCRGGRVVSSMPISKRKEAEVIDYIKKKTGITPTSA